MWQESDQRVAVPQGFQPQSTGRDHEGTYAHDQTHEFTHVVDRTEARVGGETAADLNPGIMSPLHEKYHVRYQMLPSLRRCVAIHPPPPLRAIFCRAAELSDAPTR